MNRNLQSHTNGSAMKKLMAGYKAKKVSRYMKQNWRSVAIGTTAVVILGVGIYFLIKSDLFQNGRRFI